MFCIPAFLCVLITAQALAVPVLELPVPELVAREVSAPLAVNRSVGLGKWSTCDGVTWSCPTCFSWGFCQEFMLTTCKTSNMCPPALPYCSIDKNYVAVCTADKSKSVCPSSN